MRLLLLGICLLCSTLVLAEKSERITSFDVEIDIQLDGSIEVIETISVVATGDQIKHGIYRDLPTTRKQSDGSKSPMYYEILNVLIDQQEAEFEKFPKDDYTRIKIGRKLFKLDPGEYTYVIHYRVNNQISPDQSLDGLYWNITGNNWRLPIDHSSALIHLPEQAKFQQASCYTGEYGSQASNCKINLLPDQVQVTANHAFTSGQGMTVAVGFTPGVITPKPLEYKQSIWLWVFSIPFFGVYLAYILISWRRRGVDPPIPGPIIPHFRPLEGVSPARARYIAEHIVDLRSYSATLVDMAIKGVLLMIKQDDTTYIRKLDDSKVSALQPQEQKLFADLFKEQNEIAFDEENRKHLNLVFRRFRLSIMRAPANRKLIKNNYRQYFLAVLLSTVAVAVMVYWMNLPLPSIETKQIKQAMLIDLLLWQFLFFIMLGFDFWGTQSIFKLIPVIKKTLKFKISMFVVKAFINVFYLYVFFHSFFRYMGTITNLDANPQLYFHLLPFLICLVVVFIINTVYLHLIKQPSTARQAIVAKIAGLQMYLNTAESDRLAQYDTPKRTPEEFEKMLPLAIALEMDTKWFDAFKPLLQQAIYEGSYHSSIRSGDGQHDAMGLLSELNDDLSGQLRDTVHLGDGGGGSSGGGGGGGGGGGW